MAEHVEFKCDRKCETGCMFCDGGLFACSVCDSFEGATTTDCPGERMTETQRDRVYRGELDYRDGRWREGECSRHTPAFYRKDRLRDGEYHYSDDGSDGSGSQRHKGPKENCSYAGCGS